MPDEQQLCDEAALFGLAGVRPDEKLATIRLTFAARLAPLEKQLEQGHERVGELNTWLDAAQQELTYLTQRTQANRVPRPPVGWLALGISFSVGLSVGVAGLLAIQWPTLLVVTYLMAGLIGGSGCLGTLLFGLNHYRAHLRDHDRQLTAQTDALAQVRAQVAMWQTEKQQQVAARYTTEAEVSQLTANRDRLLRLFESEYNLARSLRHRTEVMEV
jgi:hypothetical protein